MNYCSEPQILKAGQKESDIAYFLIEQRHCIYIYLVFLLYLFTAIHYIYRKSHHGFCSNRLEKAVWM